jgi:hypothetical protein
MSKAKKNLEFKSKKITLNVKAAKKLPQKEGV